MRKMSGAPLRELATNSGQLSAAAPRVRTHDANVVLQLLEEIQQLAAPGRVLATESPRLGAAAKLYLDTRDTFEAIEQKVEEHLPERPKLLRKLSKRNSLNRDIAAADLGSGGSARETPRADPITEAADGLVDDVVLDRIQDMFRVLGEQLGPAILRELARRKLPVHAILHYARFLPADCQWEAYKAARAEQVALAYRAPSPSPSSGPRTSATHLLKLQADFVKEHIRRDVDTVCLFSADGTLSTIFGDDEKADREQVADKFESLVTDVYSSYLRSVIDAQIEHLVRVSDHWQQQVAAAATRAPEPPFAQYVVRGRKYRTKRNIFASQSVAALDDRLAGLPPLLPGQALHVFVADLRHLGLWWQKVASAITGQDVSTVHTDERRGISGRVEPLDGQIYVPVVADSSQDATRRVWKSEALAKWVGQSLLVNNGKDSLWLEVRVQDVDEKKCQLELTEALAQCADLGSWGRLLSPGEWLAIRDLRFMPVPLNPSFRLHMGHKFRDVLDVIQSVVVEISSIFPNDELNQRVAHALWRSVEPSVNKGEHIYARYLRSTLSQDVLPRRLVPARMSERTSSITAPPSVRNLVAAFESSAFGASASSGAASGTPASLAIGRFGSSSNLTASGEGHGRLHRHQSSSRAPTAAARGLTLSPFEKLAHHLLEETEVVGACLQASNAALSRAFVQVFHERMTKLLRSLQATFERGEASRLEVVLTEYASSCLLLYVWRICRHQLDVVPRLARSRRDAGSMHTEWLDRTFERMDRLVLDILHQQLHFAHRAFFHECASYVLPGVYEQTWGASKLWFGNSRCTYGVQFFVARLQRLVEFVSHKLLPLYERTLAVHDKLHDLALWMLLDVLPCLAGSYEALAVSRARTVQWKIDVLYLVCGAHKLLRLLDRMLTPRIALSDDKSKRRPTAEVRCICLRLLALVAIRCGPAELVLEAVAKKVEANVFEQQIDATAELELHINALMTSLRLKPSGVMSGEDEDEFTEWYAHSVFGSMELRKLGDATLNWASVISRCSLPKTDLLAAVEKRHELGNWDFPVLSDHELRHREALQQFLRHVQAHSPRADEDASSRGDKDDDESKRGSRGPSPAPTPALERDAQAAQSHRHGADSERAVRGRIAELSAEDEWSPRDSDAPASSDAKATTTEQQSSASATPRANTIEE
ncbi:hypothetical protein PybrP1_003128 [[Pythium] brassicae (nom. inval.)]|nr:hypothetical protein PybrP1_003128 [[Pythium] brassicae (nom. inval.)]